MRFEVGALRLDVAHLGPHVAASWPACCTSWPTCCSWTVLAGLHGLDWTGLGFKVEGLAFRFEL